MGWNFLWWDFNRGKSKLILTTSNGNPYATTNKTPEYKAVVDPIQMYCNGACGTYCNSGSGYTYYWNSHKGSQYAGSKGYSYTYWANWCYLCGGCNASIANNVTNVVANNGTPVLVGTYNYILIVYCWKQEIGYTQNTWALCYLGYRYDNANNYWIHWKDLYFSCKFFVY